MTRRRVDHEPGADPANKFAATNGTKSPYGDSPRSARWGGEPTQVGLARLLPRFQPPGGEVVHVGVQQPAGVRLRFRRACRAVLVFIGTMLIGPVIARAAEHADGGNVGMSRTQIVKEDYRGWPNTYRLSNGLVEARVVTDVGPRIADFHPAGGTDLLYVRDSEAGKHGEDQWMQRGGWRLWIAPERTATTYALDNAPCAAEVVADDTLRVTGPPQPVAGIQKRIDVMLRPGERRLHIESHIKNVSERPLTYAAWSLPVLRPGGRAFIPQDVGPLTAFDATRRLLLWSYTKVGDPRYHFGDRLVEIDHTQVKAAPAMQAGRRDDESKIGVDSTQGWAAYLLDGALFLKRFPHDAKGQYPDGGATIEVYSSHEFLELENLGPLTTIKPGEEIILPEDWWVFTGVDVPKVESAALAALQGYVVKTDRTYP